MPRHEGRQRKSGVSRCLLMSAFICGCIIGGCLVIDLSSINPWSKPPDPVYNIVPPWGMCYVSPQPVLKAQIDCNSLAERLQEVLQEQNKISEKMKTMEDEFQRHKQVTEDAVAEGGRQCNASLRNTSSALNRTLDHFYNDTLEKFAALEGKRELVYRVIEHMNFMRADSWGLLVLLMGAMEVALFFYICFFLNNWRARSPHSRIAVQRS